MERIIKMLRKLDAAYLLIDKVTCLARDEKNANLGNHEIFGDMLREIAIGSEVCSQISKMTSIINDLTDELRERNDERIESYIRQKYSWIK